MPLARAVAALRECGMAVVAAIPLFFFQSRNCIALLSRFIIAFWVKGSDR